MSIILKGIGLPKEQSLLVFIANNGAVVCSGEDGVTTTEAIQIPKGARLIDANEISKDLEEWKQRPNNDDGAVVLVNHFQGIIRTAPTILESEVMPK